MTTNEEGPKETIDMIAAYVFHHGGADWLRRLFANPQFCWFRDEITNIADLLKAHGLDAAAGAMYAMAPDFQKVPRTNPYPESDPNRGFWEWSRDRAERSGESESFWQRNRDLHRENILTERGFGCDWRVAQWAQEEAERKTAGQ